MPSSTVDSLWQENIIADHWRALFLPSVIRKFSLAQQIDKIKNYTQTGDVSQSYYCNTRDCVEGIYYGPKCSPTNMYTCATLLSSYPGKNQKYLEFESVEYSQRIPLGTDHLIFYGVWGRVWVFPSRFSFYFLPIENQRIFFFHSLRAKIFFSGQSKNKIFFSKQHICLKCILLDSYVGVFF